jgi:hypothetical protein
MADLHSLLSGRLEGLRRNGDGTFQARCPACAAEGGDSQKQHLRIWPSSAFRCAKYGDDKTHNRVVRALIYADSDPDTLAALEVEFVDPEPKLEVEKVFPEEMLTKLTPNYRYWVGRGISEDVLRRMGGGLAPAEQKSKLAGRYVFPVRDTQGRIVGWTGRLVSDASFGPKHKHLVKASKVVFPIHVTGDAIRARRTVVLVESVGDMLSLLTHGVDCVLVLLGLNLNSRILGFLVAVNVQRVIISTNNDTIGRPESKSAGNKAADKIRDKLVPFVGEDKVVIRLPTTAKDWNAAEVTEIEAFRHEVIDAVDNDVER